MMSERLEMLGDIVTIERGQTVILHTIKRQSGNTTQLIRGTIRASSAVISGFDLAIIVDVIIVAGMVHVAIANQIVI